MEHTPAAGVKNVDIWAVNDIAVHPVKKSVLCTAGSEGTFVFWDTARRVRNKSSPKLDGAVTAAAFNHDGNILAYAVGYDWAFGYARIARRTRCGWRSTLSPKSISKAVRSKEDGAEEALAQALCGSPLLEQASPWPRRTATREKKDVGDSGHGSIEMSLERVAEPCAKQEEQARRKISAFKADWVSVSAVLSDWQLAAKDLGHRLVKFLPRGVTISFFVFLLMFLYGCHEPELESHLPQFGLLRIQQ